MAATKFNLGICFLVLATSIAVVTMPVAHGGKIAEEPKEIEQWFKNLPNAKEKMTKLDFYLHDGLGGEKATAVLVAQSNGTSESITAFGDVFIMDNILTIEPNPNSKIIGRAKGLYAWSSLEEGGLHVAFNYVFTDGKYNGSTLSVLGFNPVARNYREMPIVGGTGAFRLAHGIVYAQPYSFNATTGNAVAHHSLLFVHY